MEYFTLFLIGIFTFGTIITCAGEKAEQTARLTVFSTPEIAKALHSRIYKTMSHSEAERVTVPETKKKICHYVTGSDLIRKFTYPLSEYERIYMYEIYDELRTNSRHSHLFDEIYEKSPSGPVPPDNRDMVYVNTSKRISVFDPESEANADENAFVCLVREKKANSADSTFVKYYVSEEYNVRDAASQLTRPPIAGRFIYQHSEHDGKITVFGLAEEPASVVTISVRETENRYLERRRGRTSVSDESEELFCKLKKNERLRMCNVVMNAARYDGISRFTGFPVTDDDDEKCKKRPVTFVSNEAKAKAESESESSEEKVDYAEWMIPCKVKHYVPAVGAVDDVYHLSHAYGSSDEVFVFRQQKKKDDHDEYVLENLTINVRYEVPLNEEIIV